MKIMMGDKHRVRHRGGQGYRVCGNLILMGEAEVQPFPVRLASEWTQ
jgi:hypothetical protein